MGTGASKSPTIGVPVNPRVYYADTKSQKSGKHELIDAPSLARLNQQGTIRYRYTEKESDPADKQNRIEHPHEGEERSKKQGYFFHAKLNDFSEHASYNKEEDWKFRYVYKGPKRANQKKVFYVYGLGWDPQNKSLKTRLDDAPSGPPVLRIPNHVYYNLIFLSQDAELPDGNDEAEDMANEEELDITKNIELKVGALERVQKLRQRMSVRLLKPIGQIHIFLRNQELRPEDVIGDQRKPMEGQWKRFAVLLKPF